MRAAAGRLQTLFLAAVLAFGSIPLMGGSAEAEPLLSWANRYNSQSPSNDVITDFAVDASGNAYVTGLSEPGDENRTWMTAKFDPQGVLLWEAHYYAPLTGHIEASALAVDAQGNVYVTGSCEGASWRNEITTIKYDPNGNELWAARYHGLREGADNKGYALVLDDAGNAYVAGYSVDDASGGWDYRNTTIKYDPNGNEIWVSHYDAPSSSPKVDIAKAVALDGAGNVIVAGYVDLGPYEDLTTVKYDPDGNELWAVLYAGPEDRDDRPKDLAADASGNVYVLADTGFRNSTIKYDPDGDTVWVERHPDLWDANALVLDQNENVYVAGTIQAGTTDYFALVKYDSGGNLEWEALYDGPEDDEDWISEDEAHDVVLDTTGHLYVTGGSRNENGDHDCLTVKVDPVGDILWVGRYDGPSHSTDIAHHVALGPAENPYVAGYSRMSPNYRYNDDITMLKYNPDGNQLWATQHDGPPGEGEDTEDRAVSIVADNGGNAYVCVAGENLQENIDYRTIKYDAAGNELWTAKYHGPVHGTDEPVAIHVDALGNVYTSGSSEGDGTGWDYATVKYDSAGNQVWATRYEGSAYGTGTKASDMVGDSLGNVYVTGSSDTVSSSRDYTTVKIDPNGDVLWVAMYDGPTSNTDEAAAVAADEAGNVYVTGRSHDGDYGYVTIKYDPAGHELWAARYAGSSCEASSVAVDSSGGVYVTGSCTGIGMDYVTVKYDDQGNQLWVKSLNGPGNGDDLARDLALTSAGEVLVTGESLGDGTWADVATVKFSTDGATLWIARYNMFVNTWDTGTAVVADDEGNAYVTGISEGLTGHKDYVTIKHAASTGNRVWVMRHDEDNDDEAVALALGPGNSIFVTGTVGVDEHNPAIVTLKYQDEDEEPSWGVASSAMPEVSGANAPLPAGLLAHLLVIFPALLGTAVWLRLRRVRTATVT